MDFATVIFGYTYSKCTEFNFRMRDVSYIKKNFIFQVCFQCPHPPAWLLITRCAVEEEEAPPPNLASPNWHYLNDWHSLPYLGRNGTVAPSNSSIARLVNASPCSTNVLPGLARRCTIINKLSSSGWRSGNLTMLRAAVSGKQSAQSSLYKASNISLIWATVTNPFSALFLSGKTPKTLKRSFHIAAFAFINSSAL